MYNYFHSFPLFMFCDFSSPFWSVNIGQVLTGVFMPLALIFVPLKFNATRTNRRLKHLRRYSINTLQHIHQKLKVEVGNYELIIKFLKEESNHLDGHVIDLGVNEILVIDYDDLLKIFAEDLIHEEKKDLEIATNNLYHFLASMRGIKEHHIKDVLYIEKLTEEEKRFVDEFYASYFKLQTIIGDMNKFLAVNNKEIYKEFVSLLEGKFPATTLEASKTHPKEMLETMAGFMNLFNGNNYYLNLPLITDFSDEIKKLAGIYYKNRSACLGKVAFVERSRDYYDKQAKLIALYIEQQQPLKLKNKFLRLQ